MEKNDLLCIYGGASLNSTVINALVRLGTLILEVGRALGSAARRTMSGNYCN